MSGFLKIVLLNLCLVISNLSFANNEFGKSPIEDFKSNYLIDQIKQGDSLFIRYHYLDYHYSTRINVVVTKVGKRYKWIKTTYNYEKRSTETVTVSKLARLSQGNIKKLREMEVNATVDESGAKAKGIAYFEFDFPVYITNTMNHKVLKIEPNYFKELVAAIEGNKKH